MFPVLHNASQGLFFFWFGVSVLFLGPIISTFCSLLRLISLMEDYKYLFKVVLVGNAGVGKTCLVRQFTQGMFPPGQGATIGVDFMIKTLEIQGEKIKLQIWDTAGQERFRSITQSYYRSAHALILVFDVSNQPTFDSCPEWLREIEEYASPKVLKVLVGNKTDRDDREIPEEIGDDFAQRYSMYYLETSAKSCDNVEKLFYEIAQELLQQAKSKELPSYSNSTHQILQPCASSEVNKKCCQR
eukprot:TRINITY_DN3719_c0_g1_i1.p1 TRINITY_DN3719_c0_g1~~TRINITY_DN3719_c0_g1_i1.p1  ORF type:complete len:243 (+),score=36.44 TRINITY_DN3719_c0_g1_i1:87-815(+)